MFTRHLAAAVMAVVALASTGCASTVEPDPAPPVPAVEGLFDAGGYSLYLACQGSGSPTVLYFHGSAFEPNSSSRGSAGVLPELIRGSHRICVYDRLGVGDSDDRPDLNTGLDAVDGIHQALESAGAKGPYVLLGASFGGLVAYIYAKAYPEQVSGLLLLDASFPDDLTLDPLLPREERFDATDWSQSDENISQLIAYSEALAMRGNEPDIPVTYLRATPQTWTLGFADYDAAILETQEAYVDSFPQGLLIEVESDHYMESDVPEQIVTELDALIDRI